MAYEVTAEMTSQTGEPPRVALTILNIPGEQVLRVERTVSGETTIVPRARRVRASTAVLVTDFFPGLNVPTTYVVWVGGQAMATTTITVASEVGWIQDPIYPDQAIPVSGNRVAGALMLTSDSLQEVNYGAGGEQIRTLGSRYGVVIGANRSAAQNVVLAGSSMDRGLDAKIRELVAQAAVLVLRPLPEMLPLPGVAYLHADFTDSPFTTHWGGDLARFTLSGNLVQAIIAAYRSGLATYQDASTVLSGYTYAQVAALRAGLQYVDVHKDPTRV